METPQTSDGNIQKDKNSKTCEIQGTSPLGTLELLRADEAPKEILNCFNMATQGPTSTTRSKESESDPNAISIRKGTSTTRDRSPSATEETDSETPVEQESNDATLTPGGLTEGEVKKLMDQWDEHLAMSPEEVAKKVEEFKAAGDPMFVSDDEYDEDDEKEESDLEMFFP